MCICVGLQAIYEIGSNQKYICCVIRVTWAIKLCLLETEQFFELILFYIAQCYVFSTSWQFFAFCTCICTRTRKLGTWNKSANFTKFHNSIVRLVRPRMKSSFVFRCDIHCVFFGSSAKTSYSAKPEQKWPISSWNRHNL